MRLNGRTLLLLLAFVFGLAQGASNPPRSAQRVEWSADWRPRTDIQATVGGASATVYQDPAFADR
jgi:hypothetical protein